jgi:protein-S-isoprenylcysteine O-methyltransferase Ste14
MAVFTFNPHMTRTWLTVAALADAYFLFGALVEERRLLKRFGAEYAEYRERVPLLVPGPGALLRALRKGGQ